MAAPMPSLEEDGYDALGTGDFWGAPPVMEEQTPLHSAWQDAAYEEEREFRKVAKRINARIRSGAPEFEPELPSAHHDFPDGLTIYSYLGVPDPDDDETAEADAVSRQSYERLNAESQRLAAQSEGAHEATCDPSTESYDGPTNELVGGPLSTVGNDSMPHTTAGPSQPATPSQEHSLGGRIPKKRVCSSSQESEATARSSPMSQASYRPHPPPAQGHPLRNSTSAYIEEEEEEDYHHTA